MSGIDSEAPAPPGGQATEGPAVGSPASSGRAKSMRGRASPPEPSVRRTLGRAPFKQALRRIPRAAWICALVAFLNAASWSIVTPPFQITDEPTHFAYTQQLAENVGLPTSSESRFSPEERAVLEALRYRHVRGRPQNGTISSSREQQALQEVFQAKLSRNGNGAIGGAAVEPPLYYLLQAIPYGLASGGTLLDQLEAMRLLSAMLAGVAALFVFLFLREALPAKRWAWTVGGLCAALAPLVGYISGAVDPDAMLLAVAAMIFYSLARAFRRGLTLKLAVAIGVLTAVGSLTKINFVGLAPGVILGLIVLSIRASRLYGRRAASRSLVVALAIAAAPVCAYALVNLLSNRQALGVASATLAQTGKGKSLFDEVSYVWQFYLPRLPGMTNYFPGISTTRQLWFDKSVGFYGWLDTSFPAWVDGVALVPAGLILALFVRALIAGRGALRARLAEILVYGTIAVGLMVLTGASAYLNAEGESLGFAEPRYLLSLLPLVAAALALAARGAGRRWGPLVGALIITLFIAHDIFSQLLVISRFYG